MQKTLRESALSILEAYRNEPIEGTVKNLREKYPNITLEESRQVKRAMLAIIDSKTKEEQSQRGREYKELHKSLEKKYKRRAGSN